MDRLTSPGYKIPKRWSPPLVGKNDLQQTAHLKLELTMPV
jgi:hypothetical protein